MTLLGYKTLVKLTSGRKRNMTFWRNLFCLYPETDQDKTNMTFWRNMSSLCLNTGLDKTNNLSFACGQSDH